MSIKRIEDKLIYTDIPLVWVVLTVPTLLYLVLALFKLVPFGLMQQIAGILYAVVLLLTFRYCKIVFDLRNRTISWTKYSPFKKDSGICLFDQVKELAVDRVWIEASESQDAHYEFRIVLRLPDKDIALSDHFESDVDSIKFKVEQIIEATQFSTSAKFLSLTDEKIKRVGQND